MRKKDIIVRIVQPAEKPQIEPSAFTPEIFVLPENDLHHLLANWTGLLAIVFLGIVIAVSFFHFGFSFNDILIMVGIPLAVGIVTSYAVF